MGKSEHHQASKIQVAIIRSSATIIQRKLQRYCAKQHDQMTQPAWRGKGNFERTSKGVNATQPSEPKLAGKNDKYCSMLDNNARTNTVRLLGYSVFIGNKLPSDFMIRG